MSAVDSQCRRYIRFTGAWVECCRYLDDLNTVLVPELMPDLPAKGDSDANPGAGRQADEVGEFYFMHRCAPAWTENFSSQYCFGQQSSNLGACC